MTEKKIICNHPSVVMDTSGSVRLVAGEIVDDVNIVYICLDCGEEWEE